MTMTTLQGISLIHELADRYQLLNEIGSGGMGVVYRAHDRALERLVAIKMLPGDLTSAPADLSRLRKEATSAAQLHHPNIALIYDFGQADDTAFIAMEYVEGVSLRQLLEAGPLAPARALHILSQVAQALAHAHGIGITHRDIKPSNILISTSGDVDHATLIDFGLAEMPTGNQSQTIEYGAFGTPAYMSPEQARGLGCDARSDQYALAIVAYEMLTGRTPFSQHNTATALHAQIYELPPAPTELNPALPTSINAVIGRALAKPREARFPSAMAFVQALSDAMQPAPTPRASSPSPQHLRTIIGLVAGVFVLTSVALLWRAANRTANTAVLPSKVMWAHTPESMSKASPVLVADASGAATQDGSVVIGMVNGAITSLRLSDGGVRWRLGGDDNVLSAPAVGRNLIFVGASEMVLGLSPSSGGTVWRTRVSGSVPLAPVLVGDRLVAATDKGYVYVLYADNGEVVWSRPLNEDVSAFTVAQPWLFLTAGRTLYALDLRNGTVQWTFQDISRFSAAPVLAGSHVLVATERGELHGFDVASGQEKIRLALRGTVSAPPLVIDGVVYVADQAGHMAALRQDDGTEQWHFAAGASLLAPPLQVNDRLLLGASNGTLYILDMHTGQVLDKHVFGGAIVAAPLFANGVAYVVADRVYALRL